MNVLSDAFGLFQKGGMVMYPLLFCSVAVVAIAVERFRYYREAAKGVPELLNTLRNKVSAGDWQGVRNVCHQSPGVIAAVLTAGLKRAGNVESMRSALESAAAIEAANLRRNIEYLDIVVTVAPLLGLLGTVIGMINSFSILSVKQGDPSAITGGVAEALVATAAGLCVAVLALAVHSYFKQRLDGVITDMEKACALVLNTAKDERP